MRHLGDIIRTRRRLPTALLEEIPAMEPLHLAMELLPVATHLLPAATHLRREVIPHSLKDTAMEGLPKRVTLATDTPIPNHLNLYTL